MHREKWNNLDFYGGSWNKFITENTWQLWLQSAFLQIETHQLCINNKYIVLVSYVFKEMKLEIINPIINVILLVVDIGVIILFNKNIWCYSAYLFVLHNFDVLCVACFINI